MIAAIAAFILSIDENIAKNKHTKSKKNTMI
jgi:hypothetical protein